MKIFRILLVCNEADIIEQNLLYHKDKSDGLIVTDNSSNDGTREVLQKYLENGIITEIIDEPEQNYNQYLWTTRMSELARDKYKADWVYSTDVDEFWDIPELNTFKKALEIMDRADINVLKCEFFNMLPEPNKSFAEFKYKITNKLYSNENLSNIYNLFKTVNDNPDNKYKVLYSTSGFKKNWQGNHNVDISNKEELIIHIEILHYPIRSYEQFKAKIIQGGGAYERNREFSAQIGSHWRLLYKAYKNGDFDQEYDKIVGKSLSLTELLENDIIRQVIPLGGLND